MQKESRSHVTKNCNASIDFCLSIILFSCLVILLFGRLEKSPCRRQKPKRPDDKSPKRLMSVQRYDIFFIRLQTQTKQKPTKTNQTNIIPSLLCLPFIKWRLLGVGTPSRRFARQRNEVGTPSRRFARRRIEVGTPSRRFARRRIEVGTPSHRVARQRTEVGTPSRRVARRRTEAVTPSRRFARRRNEVGTPSRRIAGRRTEVGTRFCKPQKSRSSAIFAKIILPLCFFTQIRL